MERIAIECAWTKVAPVRVTFKNVQHAIYQANKAPPASKAIAWKNAYLLSEQYQRQEKAEEQLDANGN